MFGSYQEKFSSLRAFYGFMMALPGKKLLFMGGEFGQFIEWRYDSGLDWLLLAYDSHKRLLNYEETLTIYIGQTRAYGSWTTSKRALAGSRQMIPKTQYLLLPALARRRGIRLLLSPTLLQ